MRCRAVRYASYAQKAHNPRPPRSSGIPSAAPIPVRSSSVPSTSGPRIAVKNTRPLTGAPAYQCPSPGTIDRRAARPGLIGRCFANFRVPSMISPVTGCTLSWAPQRGQKSASAGTGLSQREQVCMKQAYIVKSGDCGDSPHVALPTVPAPEKASVSITVQIRDGIARITLDRPPLNVLDVEILRRLNDALRECDARSIRVVVLSSALP